MVPINAIVKRVRAHLYMKRSTSVHYCIVIKLEGNGETTRLSQWMRNRHNMRKAKCSSVGKTPKVPFGHAGSQRVRDGAGISRIVFYFLSSCGYGGFNHKSTEGTRWLYFLILCSRSLKNNKHHAVIFLCSFINMTLIVKIITCTVLFSVFQRLLLAIFVSW